MLTWKHGRLVCAALAAMSLGTVAYAQAAKQPESVLPGRPGEASDQALVGDYFESRAAGITLRRPVDSKEIRRTGVRDLVVEFVNDKKNWVVRVSMRQLDRPMALDVTKDAAGRRQDGLVQDTIAGFKSSNQAATVLREEVTKVGEYEMGLVALRYGQTSTEGTVRKLTQEALIPMPPLPGEDPAAAKAPAGASQEASRFYYIITMTSPGAKGNDTETVDPKEKEAADVFTAMIESVHLLDRGSIRKDKVARIENAQQLLLDLKDRKAIEKAIVPEQYLRLVKDGKDIGFTYVAEELGHLDSRDGALVSIRSHTVPVENVTVDVVSRLFMSYDWRHEAWTHAVTTRDAKSSQAKDANVQASSEFGISDVTDEMAVDDAKMQDPKILIDPKTPPMKQVTRHRLEVRSQIGRVLNRPYIVEQLPEWYLPQAIGRLLPRMAQAKGPRNYAFFAFVSESQELVMRYIDVEATREVTFAGKRIVATPVKDRVGYEGVPTTYYIDADGHYLGSEVVYEVDGKRSVVQAILTDATTLQKLWPGAQLTKPKDSELPDTPRRANDASRRNSAR